MTNRFLSVALAASILINAFLIYQNTTSIQNNFKIAEDNREMIVAMRWASELPQVSEYLESKFGPYKMATIISAEEVEFEFEDGKTERFNRTELLANSFNWNKGREAAQ